MGNDGGSIPTRGDLVQLAKKPEKADAVALERTKWFYCAMSKQPFRSPVVACELGFLYNKEIVLKHLLDKSIPENFSHVKSLKDLITLNFKNNPDFKPLGEKNNIAASDLAEDSPFICPVAGLLVGSNHKFSALRTCGCVFSDRAIRECPSDICLSCNKAFTAQDILILNPDEEDLKLMKQKLAEKKTKSTKKKSHSEKESNSSSKRKLETSSTTTTTTTTTTSMTTTSNNDENALKKTKITKKKV